VLQALSGIRELSCDDAMRMPSRWLRIMVRAPVPRFLVLLFYSASIANTFGINPFPSPGLYPVHTNTVFKLRDTPQSFATQTLRWALPTYCLDIVRLISYRIFTPKFLTRTVINRMRWVTCENPIGISQRWSIDPPKSKVQKSNSSVDVPPTVG